MYCEDIIVIFYTIIDLLCIWYLLFLGPSGSQTPSSLNLPSVVPKAETVGCSQQIAVHELFSPGSPTGNMSSKIDSVSVDDDVILEAPSFTIDDRRTSVEEGRFFYNFFEIIN